MRVSTNRILLLFSTIVLGSSISQAEDIPNYCHDPEANAKWERIVKHEAHNHDVVNLYRLRKELCRQVEKGFIGVPEATEIFEDERERVIKDLPLPRA